MIPFRIKWMNEQTKSMNHYHLFFFQVQMNELKVRQILSCVITGLSYVTIYLIRKPLGVVKTDLQTNYHLTKNQLGWMDTSFFLPYAIVQIVCGNLGDRYGARAMITMNLLLASISMISFGFWDSPYLLSVLLFVSGAAQATLWPNCVKHLSDWFVKDQLATVFGILGSVIFAGGILGTVLAVYLQNIYAPDLRMIFLLPSLIGIFMAVIVWSCLKTPNELNIVVGNNINSSNTDSTTTGAAEKKNLNFVQVWKIKLVPELSFTMFGIKLVRYCLYMWLPMYLHQNLKYDKATAGYLSTAFEIGCVIGSTSLGYVIDRFLGGRMHWGVCISIIGSALSLVFFQMTCFYGLTFNFFFLLLTGAFQSGPDMIVTGALAIEVGRPANAEGAVCGIVNGFGSVGTIAQGPLIAFIVTHFGWGGSFYAMIALTMFGALAIAKAAMIQGRDEAHGLETI